jgi:hypothetical protein
VRVEDGGEARAVRSPVLRDIIDYLVHYQDRLGLDEHSGELLVSWGPRGTTARPRPVLPTRPGRARK